MEAKKRSYNARVLSVYFPTEGELRIAKEAAKKAGLPLVTFIRRATLRAAGRVLAA